MKRKYLALLGVAVLMGSLAAQRVVFGAAAQPPQSPIKTQLQKVASGLSEPVFVTHANDSSGKLYVVEQAGKVRVLENGKLRKQHFMDISKRVKSDGNEQGLLSIAFAPDYAASGLVYANYTEAKAGDTVVAQFKANVNSGVVDVKSERILLTVTQPYANHNGGQIQFGPDGMLYIGMGDGGSAGDPQNVAQNLQSKLGKMLRIDVRNSTSAQPYQIPSDNPVYPGVERTEIWSVGLRNPWRFSFDRATGDLYIADVGQNAHEEINMQPAGRSGDNYGWKLREGLDSYDGEKLSYFSEPISAYPHSMGCSVTGGYVYRGSAMPELQGAYVYGDYCEGTVWTLKQNAVGAWVNETLLEGNYRISSFGEDEKGELYLLDHANGVLYKIAKK